MSVIKAWMKTSMPAISSDFSQSHDRIGSVNRTMMLIQKPINAFIFHSTSDEQRGSALLPE